MRTLITGIGLIGSRLAKHFPDAVKIDHRPVSDDIVYGDVRYLPDVGHDVSRIYHLACPASPIEYQKDPLFTISTIVDGTKRMLDIAENHGVRILIASTSEIYGDPEVTPQTEEYNGNVRTQSRRACYDESKRLGETLAYEYQQKGVDVRVARIFNTYGVSPHGNDGRLVSMLINSTKKKEPITIFGDGMQTRSLCWVEDTCEGLMALMESDETRPTNIGNPCEIQVSEIVRTWQMVHKIKLPIIHKPLPDADPVRRCPDITRAKALGWEPKTNIREGFKLCLSGE